MLCVSEESGAHVSMSPSLPLSLSPSPSLTLSQSINQSLCLSLNEMPEESTCTRTPAGMIVETLPHMKNPVVNQEQYLPSSIAAGISPR